MKALTEMNNLEKGKLFADLFPDEIKGILNAMVGITTMMKDSKEEIIANWDNGFMNVVFWYRLADEVRSIVDKGGDKLTKPRLFANELFDGYLALFTVHCIMTYVEKHKKGTKIWHLANAFFNYQ